MNLPDVITAFVEAQNNFDSTAYTDCFNPEALVFDEGRNHHGRTEIKAWIEEANEKYQAVMEPVDYSGSSDMGVLSARVSGTFDGSPILLNYRFEFAEGHIQSLKITG